MPLDRLLQLPKAPAPNDDPSSIKGNLTTDQKQLMANILAYHVSNHPTSKVFAHEVAGKLKLVEANVRKTGLPTDGGAEMTEAETVHEVTVEEGMLNVHGSLSGPCVVHFLDFITFSTLFCHGLVSDRDASGVSTSMNVIWHGAAKLGTVLRIVSTSLAAEGRTAASRAEVYDKKTGRILVSIVHTIMPFEKPAGKL